MDTELNWLEFENKAYAAGYKSVCGVDEAGRGPLAGPVFAAAVILRPGQMIEGVNDSKKLTEKKREKLFDVIRDEALAFNIACATVDMTEARAAVSGAVTSCSATSGSR